MALPRSVADVLADHVLFEVECIDRMYLNVPRLGLGRPRARPAGAARPETAHRLRRRTLQSAQRCGTGDQPAEELPGCGHAL
jgi:hypothetical protein